MENIELLYYATCVCLGLFASLVCYESRVTSLVNDYEDKREKELFEYTQYLKVRASNVEHDLEMLYFDYKKQYDDQIKKFEDLNNLLQACIQDEEVRTKWEECAKEILKNKEEKNEEESSVS